MPNTTVNEQREPKVDDRQFFLFYLFYFFFSLLTTSSEMSTFEALRCSIHKYHHYYDEKNKKQTWYAIVKTLETGSNEYFIFITFSLF